VSSEGARRGQELLYDPLLPTAGAPIIARHAPDFDDEDLDDELDPEGPSEDDLERFSGATVRCPGCGGEVHDESVSCPRCGEFMEDSSGSPARGTSWWTIAVGGAILLALLAWAIGR